MWVILTYDVGVKRNRKALKICRKYLNHVQKSVFEGHLTNKQYNKLKYEISKIIEPDNDQVAFYVLDSIRSASKEVIGYHISQDNII